MTKSRSELSQEAQKFCSYLSTKGMSAVLNEASFRDYHVKIVFSGNIVMVLYHKPSKNSFSISTHEISDLESKHKIQQLWHNYCFPDEENSEGICAYVDGSFYSGKIGWGLVLTENNNILAEKNGIVNLSPEEGGRQIAGEVQAVLEALNYASENKIKEITIYYDYKGLEMWATKKWKAQSPIAQYYSAKLMQNTVRISWRKISAHTGHIFNEKADKLAKQAVEMGKF